jgi:hypothetical protein
MMMRFPQTIEIEGEKWTVVQAEYQQNYRYSGNGPVQREMRITLVHMWEPDVLPKGWVNLVVDDTDLESAV